MVKLYIIPPFRGDIQEGVYQLVTQDALGIGSVEARDPEEAKRKLLTENELRLKALSEYLKDGYELEVADEAKNDELFAINQRTFLTLEARMEYSARVLKVGEKDLTSIS